MHLQNVPNFSSHVNRSQAPARTLALRELIKDAFGSESELVGSTDDNDEITQLAKKVTDFDLKGSMLPAFKVCMCFLFPIGYLFF